MSEPAGIVLTPDAQAERYDLVIEDVFPRIVSTRPVSKAAFNKAMALTIVKESPTITAVASAGMAAGTIVGKGNPVVGLAVSKLAPLGYVGYKAAELSLKSPQEFWQNLADLEHQTEDPSFWRGAGRSYTYGKATKHFPTQSTNEFIGEMAGMIVRDLTVAAGFGNALAAYSGAAQTVQMGARSVEQLRSAKRMVDLANGLSFAASMGVNHGVTQYNTEIGAGTDERRAFQIGMSSGIASGASGAVFMAIAPLAIAKFAGRYGQAWQMRPFVSASEWAGWVGVEHGINNMVRTRAYGLEDLPEQNMGDIATLAGVGAALSVVGLVTGSALSRAYRMGENRVGKYVLNKYADQDIAQRALTASRSINLPNIPAEKKFGPNLPESTGGLATANGIPVVTKEIAAMSGVPKNGQIDTGRGVALVGDERAFALTERQSHYMLDKMRDLMRGGSSKEEATRTVWNELPAEMRNTGNMRRLLRALNIER